MGSHEDSRRWDRSDGPPPGPTFRADRDRQFPKKREWPPPPNAFERDLGPPHIPGASKRGRLDAPVPRYFPGGPRDIDRGPPSRHGFGPRRSPPHYRSPSRRPPGDPSFPPHDSRGRGSPPQGERRSYDWPPPRGKDLRTSWDAGWRGGRLPPPPQRHLTGRDGQDSPPLMRSAGSGSREKGGWDSWDARGPHSEYAGLHRTTSHPGPGGRGSSSSPHNSPSFLANGSHRGEQLLKHTSLPHHLSGASHSLPPGIFGATRETPLPAPPPLLDTSVGAPSPLAKTSGSAAAQPPPLLTVDAPKATAATVAATPMPAAGATGGPEPMPPAAEAPPKRQRLGWGQGLARLRTAESAGRAATEDHLDQSPRNSEASRHTDPKSDSLHSPTFSARIRAEQHPHAPSIVSSPADPSRAPQQLVSPYSNASGARSHSLPTPPPLLPIDGVDVRSPLEFRASADSICPQKDGTPSLQPPGLAGYPAAQGSMLPPAESLTKTESAGLPEQAPPGPSKEEIMEGIDKVDTDIQALEKEVADLAASLDDISAAAVALKGNILRLSVPAEQPPPVQLSDDEYELQESSEVVLSVSKGTSAKPDSGMELESHLELKVARPRSADLQQAGSLANPLPPPEILLGLKEGDRRLIIFDEKQNFLMQQLMASNRQRQIQANMLLLPLAHPHMFKDAPKGCEGAPPELKEYLYLKVEDIPAVRDFPREHRFIDRAMRRQVRLRAAQQKHRQRDLAAQYRVLYDQWQARCAAKLGLTGKGKGAFLQRGFSARKAARSDYEEQQMLLGLKAVEKMKQMVLVPDQLQDPYEKAMRKFDNRNALIEDPVECIQEEKKLRPWMPEERRIFNEKFLTHPKDFRRIAQFLDGRTTGDCVVHYYRMQKLDEFAAVRRKMQLKKRRMQSENNRAVSYMGVPMAGAAKRGELAAIANPDFGRLQPALVPLPEVLPGARSGPKPGRATRAGRGGGPGAAAPGVAKAGRLAGAQLTEGTAEGMLQHGDEDWTPADEGAPAENTKRFGRGGESSAWTAAEEKLFLEGLNLYGMDFPAIRKHMGQSRTLGAVRSYFSKNRKRLDLDRIAEEAQVRSGAEALPMQQGLRQPSRRPSPQGAAAAEQAAMQAEAGSPSLASQPMGAPGVSGGFQPGPYGPLGQGPGMGEGLEAADMLSTLQAMSAHGGVMGGLMGVLNNPMQPPFPQQGMQQMGSQGMGDPAGLLAGIPQGLQGLPPQLAAQLMQAQAAQSNPMHNPLQMLQLMQNMGTLPPHMLPLLLQAQMQQMAAGGPGPHGGGLPPGMNPLLNMGVGPGGILSGMHPLANLQNQLQNFALFQAMGGMPGGDRQLPRGGQMPPSSFPPDSEQAYLHQQHALQQLNALESLARQQAGSPMHPAGVGQLPNPPGLDMGGQQFKLGNPSWGKETPEQHDLLQRPASEAPVGGLLMRQLEVLPAMKRSASADSVPHITAEDATETVVAKRQISLWTDKEKSAFMEAYKVHGRDWARLAAAVPSKTLTQIKNYYQNYKVKLGLDRIELPENAKQPVSRKRTKSEAGSPASSSMNAPSPVGGLPGMQKRPASTPPSVEAQLAQAARQAHPLPMAGAVPLEHPASTQTLRVPSPTPERVLHEDQIAALEGANAAVAAANAQAGDRALDMASHDAPLQRLPVAQSEPWQQAGEDLHKRLTSAQADAAAEALRARVAHFMAAQQAAGQPQMGNLGSSQGPGVPAVADSASAVPSMAIPASAVPAESPPIAQSVAQQAPALPQPSSAPVEPHGPMDGSTLIEMLRSMSQAGYPGGAPSSNGLIAPQQVPGAVPDSAPLPAAERMQPSTGPAPQQADSAPGMHVPMIADSGRAALVQNASSLPQQPSPAQLQLPEGHNGSGQQEDTKRSEPVNMGNAAPHVAPEREQLAVSDAAAPAQQGADEAQHAQQSADQGSLPGESAPQQAARETAQEATRQPEAGEVSEHAEVKCVSHGSGGISAEPKTSQPESLHQTEAAVSLRLDHASNAPEAATVASGAGAAERSEISSSHQHEEAHGQQPFPGADAVEATPAGKLLAQPGAGAAPLQGRSTTDDPAQSATAVALQQAEPPSLAESEHGVEAPAAGTCTPDVAACLTGNCMDSVQKQPDAATGATVDAVGEAVEAPLLQSSAAPLRSEPSLEPPAADAGEPEMSQAAAPAAIVQASAEQGAEGHIYSSEQIGKDGAAKLTAAVAEKVMPKQQAQGAHEDTGAPQSGAVNLVNRSGDAADADHT